MITHFKTQRSRDSLDTMSSRSSKASHGSTVDNGNEKADKYNFNDGGHVSKGIKDKRLSDRNETTSSDKEQKASFTHNSKHFSSSPVPFPPATPNNKLR